MLIDIHSGKTINTVPFRPTFDRIKARLSTAEFAGVVAEINRRIDATGRDIATAGWLPGSDWRGTSFEAIYTKAARRNQELAGKMFGLMVWHTVMARPEPWGSGRFQKNGEDIGSRTYFRVGSSAK